MKYTLKKEKIIKRSFKMQLLGYLKRKRQKAKRRPSTQLSGERTVTAEKVFRTTKNVPSNFILLTKQPQIEVP